MELRDSICSRGISIRAAEQFDFDSGIETVASTSAPTLVIDWERFEVIREVLPSRYFQHVEKVPLLDSHSRFSIENIIGSAKNFRVSGDELLAKTFISDSEPKVRQKIQEGHIDSVSIGYKVFEENSFDVPFGRDVTVDGVTYRNEFDDKIPFVVRTKWNIKELSLVPIGADEAAKFRSVMDSQSKYLIDQINQLREEIKSLKPKEISADVRHRKIKLIDHKLKMLNHV